LHESLHQQLKLIYFAPSFIGMTLLYTISIHLYYLILLAVSPFHHKARLWIKGRLGWRSRLQGWCEQGGQVIWVHAASLGEFEQGRPLIDEIKSKHPGYRLLLTFYSPSGFEIRKNYPGADHVMYLPLDTPYNARRFVKLVNPAAVIFIKYEFWRFYLRQLWVSKHPVYLISAIFRPDQVFFRWYGGWFRKNLSFFDYFFLQDESSALLLNHAGISNCIVSGDTRFDRVSAVATAAKEVEIARKFSAGHFCIVAGSTWPEDEEILTRYINQCDEDTRFIIAPHEITAAHLSQLKSRISRSFTLFSNASTDTIQDHQVLIIDNIGILSSLYRYGRLAYIGGGFGKGIHNILEAAAFGIPVIFGPNFQKFREACTLLNLGGAFAIHNASEFFEILEQFANQPLKYDQSATIAGDYVRNNTGSTAVILKALFEKSLPNPAIS
jgi:3-deoxy-D-manno-octulosonic-acid transferase